MNKVILPKQKDNVLSAKVDKVEDLGNYKLLTAKVGNLTIKSKINREIERLNFIIDHNNKIHTYHLKEIEASYKSKIEDVEVKYNTDILSFSIKIFNNSNSNNSITLKYKTDLNKFKQELNKLWIHGLVHLFGHRHKSEKDFFAMSKVEKKFLEYLNYLNANSLGTHKTIQKDLLKFKLSVNHYYLLRAN